MSGSGASNLGYSNITPLSNINGQLVNVHNTNNPANFGSNEIPGLPGLAGAKSNIDAAAGKAPGICLFKGGARKFKKKISRKYKKMAKNGKKISTIKTAIKNMMASRSAMRAFAGGKRRKTKRGTKARKTKGTKGTKGTKKTRKTRKTRQLGGYSQYQNNQPFSNSYSIGGVLTASDSALANPAPIDNVTNNAIDNYNHYTNTGFSSKGH
jgi:hypothetical protein